jgi:release factor glutamine methyltransferase
MTFPQLKLTCTNALQHIYDDGEINAMLKRIAEHTSQETWMNVITNPSIAFDEVQVQSILQRLQTHEPIQYIVEHEWFMGKQYYVNSHVLIPRPETEELVQWILDDVQDKPLTILDIGTGSGIIPISLKTTLPQCTIYASDISENALGVAMQNADTHKTDIEFVQDDILNPSFEFDTSFDIIVSNPPYITEDEKSNMNNNVLQHEPSSALFVTNNDPLQFYKAILEFAHTHASKNASIYFELNAQFALETELLFKDNHHTTLLKQDMFGKNRMLKVMLNTAK